MIKRVLIAPDKFKGSLTSLGVCEAVARGLRAEAVPGIGAMATTPRQGVHDPLADIIGLPMADGGDGLLDCLAYYTAAKPQRARVQDPLGRTVDADWLLSADGQTAFVEMAQASGLHLLQPAEYDPSRTSTVGTGQLIAEAIRSGAREIVIGIGGSATNDGGMGMAAALGYRFLDIAGRELSPCGGSLGLVERIQTPVGGGQIDTGMGKQPDIRFRVAVDVNNHLTGPEGATRVYAPQKGADAEMVERLEAGMERYAKVLDGLAVGAKISTRSGAGAAGGLGAGCMAFLGATAIRGIELVFEYSHAREQIRQADLVITGEGKIDEQTLQGKVVAGVAALAREYGKRVIAVCGVSTLTPAQVQQLGLETVLPIAPMARSTEDSMRRAGELIEEVVRRYFRP